MSVKSDFFELNEDDISQSMTPEEFRQEEL